MVALLFIYYGTYKNFFRLYLDGSEQSSDRLAIENIVHNSVRLRKLIK